MRIHCPDNASHPPWHKQSHCKQEQHRLQFCSWLSCRLERVGRAATYCPQQFSAHKLASFSALSPLSHNGLQYKLHQGQNCIDTVNRITVTSAGGLRRLYPDSVRLRTPVPVPPTSYQQRKRGHNSNSSGTVRKSEDDTVTTAFLGRCNSDMRKFVKQILPNERN